MAGDWIKMRTDLYRDPKVICMADFLMSPDGELARSVSQNIQRDMGVTSNVMRNVTVGALVAVWGVARHQGKRSGDNLCIVGVTPSVVDDIAELPGFGDAMERVGWLVKHPNGLVFPKFFKDHNADPTEKNRERQARYRERKRNVTDNVTRNVTVTTEQSRVEKRVLAPALGAADLRKAADKARKISEKLGSCVNAKNKRLLIGACVLSEELGEDWLNTAVGETRGAQPQKPYAYLRSVLIRTAGELGCDLEASIARMDFPIAKRATLVPEV